MLNYVGGKINLKKTLYIQNYFEKQTVSIENVNSIIKIVKKTFQ